MAVCIQAPREGVVMIMHNVDSIPPFIWEWCGRFHYGDKVLFRGETVIVFTAFPRDVPEGHVPVLYKEINSHIVLVFATELEEIAR